jgi:hypothetical protein
VALLVALSCLLVLLSATVVWAHRTVLNTPTFVGTVGPVFQHPEVTSAVATRAADQLFTELNLQARLRAALPPKASFAAVPITNATKSFVAGELAKVLASPRFQAVWNQALTRTHQQVVAVLRGQHTAAVSTSGGYIVLNTVPVINQALKKASGLASDLTGKPVTLPAITSAEVPQQQVNKLSKALGVPLPASFGQITLIRSSDLATVRQAVKAFDGLTLVLPLVTIALIALCLWLSVNRRRTVLQLAVGVSLLMIVERRVVLHEQSVLASGAHNPQLATTVLGDLLHGFFVLTAWVLGLALVVLVIAVLAGPYRWAAAIRRSLRRAGRGIAGATSGDRRGLDEIARRRPPAGRRRNRRDPAADRDRVMAQLPHHRRAAHRLRGRPPADQACPARRGAAPLRSRQPGGPPISQQRNLGTKPKQTSWPIEGDHHAAHVAPRSSPFGDHP